MNEGEKEYRVSRATFVLALGALGSKGVGFFREIVVAAKFGTGRAFDLYVAASAFPVFLSSIFLYALPDCLVPYLTRLKENRPVLCGGFYFGLSWVGWFFWAAYIFRPICG
jgi:putative peptidoglycan lipid II flippase